jgi:hypothetical protein
MSNVMRAASSRGSSEKATDDCGDWICIMMSRSMPHDDSKAVKGTLVSIFGQDLIGYKIACNKGMVDSGEYYVFAHCRNYWNYVETIGKCHFVTGVVPSKESPHHFSPKEIEEFLESVDGRDKTTRKIQHGDVVMVKDGYLKGTYGIVTGLVNNMGKAKRDRSSGEKCKVFFSFYIRQFSEILRMTSLEFIGRIDRYEFPVETIGKSVAIGGHVVYRHKTSKTGRR